MFLVLLCCEGAAFVLKLVVSLDWHHELDSLTVLKLWMGRAASIRPRHVPNHTCQKLLHRSQ
eukprot:5637197-Amphidinium_carterae.1